MNVAETLRAAAARVRQGWCQGKLRSGHKVCAIGALHEISGINTDDRAVGHIARALNLPALVDPVFIGPVERVVAAWNDAPDQTAENVAAGLEYAALCWEQEQTQLSTAPAAPEQEQPA